MILKRFTKFSDFTVKAPYKRRTVREMQKKDLTKERLLAILLLYDGKNIYEVAKILRMCERISKECLAKEGVREFYQEVRECIYSR